MNKKMKEHLTTVVTAIVNEDSDACSRAFKEYTSLKTQAILLGEADKDDEKVDKKLDKDAKHFGKDTKVKDDNDEKDVKKVDKKVKKTNDDEEDKDVKKFGKDIKKSKKKDDDDEEKCKKCGKEPCECDD